jgi:hypothetical protein
MADRQIKPLFTLVAGCLLVATFGCGPRGPNYQDVHGKVTLDGSPLQFKSVYFAPEPGTAGMGAGAITVEDGSYKLLAIAAGATHDIQGIQAGSYRVVVAEPMIPKSPQMIPPPYTKRDSTPLQVEVGKEGGEINLELRSRP